jgi:hypothetical protein
MSAVWLAIGGGPVYYRFDFFAWWTRSQSIRTEGEVPFEVAIVDPPEIPTYIGIAEKALHLKELNMNPNQIAVALKVDRTTVLHYGLYAGSRVLDLPLFHAVVFTQIRDAGSDISRIGGSGSHRAGVRVKRDCCVSL